MKYELDPEFKTSVRQTFEEIGIPPDRPTPRFARGDVESRRTGASFAKAILAREPEAPNVKTTRHVVRRNDDYDMSILEIRKTKNEKTSGLEPAILYLHGGGMIFGSAELFEPATKTDVATTGVAHFSV
jgi:acetyl esterase/lipase